MIFIVGDRGSGKTTALMEISQLTQVPICAPNHSMAKFIEMDAKSKGYNIPKPVIFSYQPQKDGLPISKDVLFDEVGLCTGSSTRILVATHNAEPLDLADVSLLQLVKAWIDARLVKR